MAHLKHLLDQLASGVPVPSLSPLFSHFDDPGTIKDIIMSASFSSVTEILYVLDCWLQFCNQEQPQHVSIVQSILRKTQSFALVSTLKNVSFDMYRTFLNAPFVMIIRKFFTDNDLSLAILLIKRHEKGKLNEG
jgi:hypothetical protein